MDDLEKMKEIESWLHGLNDTRLKLVHDSLFKTIDRAFLIETVMEHCSQFENVFDELFHRAKTTREYEEKIRGE
jgi:hypothetical protein